MQCLDSKFSTLGSVGTAETAKDAPSVAVKDEKAWGPLIYSPLEKESACRE